MPDWIERRDSQLVVQSAELAKRLAIDPGEFGVPVEFAAELVDKQLAFAGAFKLACAGGTNSSVARSEKDEKRDALKSCMRLVVGLARAKPGISDPQLVALNLKPPAPRRRSVSRPTLAPTVTVVGVYRRVVTIQLRDVEHPTRTSKPDNATAAAVFGFVGENPPGPDEQWKPMGAKTRTRFTLYFNDAEIPSGAKVWITAAWLGTKHQPGPSAVAAYTYIAGPPMLKLPVLVAA